MSGQSALLAGAFAMLASCSPRTEASGTGNFTGSVVAGFTDSSTSADIHVALLNPASDALYAAESDAPTTSEGWAAVERAAAEMIEGAALMQTGSRPSGRAEWIRISKLVEQAARKSADAVRATDVELLAAADGDFTAQCENCHNIFRDAPGRGMMSEPHR